MNLNQINHFDYQHVNLNEHALTNVNKIELLNRQFKQIIVAHVFGNSTFYEQYIIVSNKGKKCQTFLLTF